MSIISKLEEYVDLVNEQRDKIKYIRTYVVQALDLHKQAKAILKELDKVKEIHVETVGKNLPVQNKFTDAANCVHASTDDKDTIVSVLTSTRRLPPLNPEVTAQRMLEMALATSLGDFDTEEAEDDEDTDGDDSDEDADEAEDDPSPEAKPSWGELTIDDVKQAIQAAYFQLTRGKKLERVLLSDLRPKVGFVEEDVNDALLQLQDEDKIVLMSMDNHAERTPAVTKAAIVVGGKYPRHLMYWL